MISKELLSKILDRKVTKIHIHEHSIMEYEAPEVGFRLNENIYELSHKCKEWAATKGYFLNIRTSWLGKGAIVVEVNTFTKPAIHVVRIEFEDTTASESIKIPEPQAVFQACEWLFENLEELEDE